MRPLHLARRVRVKVDWYSKVWNSESIIYCTATTDQDHAVKSSPSRTRRMDTRYWNVHQLQEEHGLIKVHFMRTKDNVSDLGTKNVTTDVYETHEGKLITSKESVG